MPAADWSIDVPDDLWKGLVYSVAIASWRDLCRERRFGAKLSGYRPETVPLKELDRVVLRALEEHPEARDIALERFAAENAGLVAALEAAGPASAGDALSSLLRDESAARVFWAAMARGDAFAPVRDAVLARLRARTLDGAPLFPPRLDRRPKLAPRPPSPPKRAPNAASHPIQHWGGDLTKTKQEGKAAAEGRGPEGSEGAGVGRVEAGGRGTGEGSGIGGEGTGGRSVGQGVGGRQEAAGDGSRGHGTGEPRVAGSGPGGLDGFLRDFEDLRERLRRAERELARAHQDRDRLRDQAARLEEALARAHVERDRLERELAGLRHAGAADPGANGGGKRGAGGAARRTLEHEVERLNAAIVEERRLAAQAVQRSRAFKRELDEARERLEFYESVEIDETYPRAPVGVSPRAETEKIVWPSDEHHYPRRLEPFLERLARSPYVDRIQIREFEASAETRLKGIDDRGNIHLLYSDGLKAARCYLVTVAKDKHEGRWVAERLREMEPALAP